MTEKKHILFAEDDMFVSDIYKQKLEDAGFSVKIVEDGKQALEHLQEQTPDFILLDIMMPKMSGLEVLEEIAKNDVWKKIPLFLLTNLSDKAGIDKGMELGANGYFVKSQFTPSEILEKIQETLGEK